jgi:hypothetical protein
MNSIERGNQMLGHPCNLQYQIMEIKLNKIYLVMKKMIIQDYKCL